MTALLRRDPRSIFPDLVDWFEAPPVNMPAGQRALVNGVYKLDGRLLLVLNTEKTLELAAEA